MTALADLGGENYYCIIAEAALMDGLWDGTPFFLPRVCLWIGIDNIWEKGRGCTNWHLNINIIYYYILVFLPIYIYCIHQKEYSILRHTLYTSFSIKWSLTSDMYIFGYCAIPLVLLLWSAATGCLFPAPSWSWLERAWRAALLGKAVIYFDRKPPPFWMPELRETNKAWHDSKWCSGGLDSGAVATFFRRRLGTVGQNTYKNRLKIEHYSMSIYMAVYVQTMSTALNPQPHSLCPSDQQLISCKDNMTKLFEPTVKKSVNSHTWTIGRGPFRHLWPWNFQTIAGYRKELSTAKVFEVHPVHMSKWCRCIIRHLLRVWWVRQHLLPAPSMFLPESFQNACCRSWNLFTNTCAGFCEVWFADVFFPCEPTTITKMPSPLCTWAFSTGTPTWRATAKPTRCCRRSYAE